MKSLETQSTSGELADSDRQNIKSRLTDLVVFSGFLALSGIAVLAFAVATPIILLISAIVGLTSGNDDRGNWRPVAA